MALFDISYDNDDFDDNSQDKDLMYALQLQQQFNHDDKKQHQQTDQVGIDRHARNPNRLGR
jgi:hypothetical protein